MAKLQLPTTFQAPQWKQKIEQADGENRKIGSDVELHKERLILADSTGVRWVISVSSSGVLSAALAP